MSGVVLLFRLWSCIVTEKLARVELQLGRPRRGGRIKRQDGEEGSKGTKSEQEKKSNQEQRLKLRVWVEFHRVPRAGD